jgi:hypothetical protein
MTRTRDHVKLAGRSLKDSSHLPTARISVREIETNSLTHAMHAPRELKGRQDESTPGVAIKGDLRMSVTEQEITYGLITGNYSLETESMHEPLFVLWKAEGEVMTHTGKSTGIAFDLSGAQAGQLWTAVVTVQLTELSGPSRTVVSGTLVQIFVTGDRVLE